MASRTNTRFLLNGYNPTCVSRSGRGLPESTRTQPVASSPEPTGAAVAPNDVCMPARNVLGGFGEVRRKSGRAPGFDRGARCIMLAQQCCRCFTASPDVPWPPLRASGGHADVHSRCDAPACRKTNPVASWPPAVMASQQLSGHLRLLGPKTMSVNRNELPESQPRSGNEPDASATPDKVYSLVNAEAFRKGMRQLSAAVTVVTTGIDAQRRAGMTATAVCSVSAEPPQLLVCVNRRGEGHARIREWRNFCVNVLCHAQIGIAKRFAGMERGAHP